jgi:type II secretory pathway component PulF
MKKFKATIESRGGLIVKIIEANDIAHATRISRKDGQLISIKKTANTDWMYSGLGISDRQVFLQRLGAMYQSKVGAGESLSLMEQTFEGQIKRVASRMLKLVENGADIGEAMESIGAPDFPATTVALVTAGSLGGDTAAALRSAADFEMEMDRIKRDSGSGIGSAIMGFLSAVAITFGTTRYFGPKMLESDLMKIAGDSIDVGWAETLATISEISMGIFALMFLSLFLLSTVGKMVMPIVSDKIILRIPFYRDLVLSRNNYTTIYGLSLLINSGVPMEQALGLAAKSSPPGIMRDNLSNAVDNVRHGKPWAMAMDSLHPTDRAALGSSLDKEGLANSLDAISAQYRSLYGTRVAILSPVLQMISVIFLVLSGVVLFGLTVVPILQFAGAGIK